VHTPPRFSLTTLGSVRLDGPSGELLSGRRKELALLTYLARSSPRAVSREKLATLLWGERDEAKARQSLRHALHQLRRALDEAIDVSNGSIRILPGSVQLDAVLLERGIAEGRFAEALALWHGDFLSGADDIGHEDFRIWLERERETLRRILPGAFESMVGNAREEKRPADEICWARRWSECCPFDAAAQAHLIEALLAAGETGEARLTYTAFQARLRTELDATPSAEFLRLGEAIERAVRHAQERRPGSAALFSPDLVGRDSVLASLADLWSRARKEPAGALIEGEEGLGKSRLCAELARRTRSAAKGNLVIDVRAVEGDNVVQTATIHRVIAGLAESSAIEDAPNRSLVELSRIAPELRRRFPQLAAPAEESAQTESALRSAFRAIASATPTLLIVDDFAYADSVSQDLLLSLAHTLPPGMLIVFTVRPDLVAGTNLVSEMGRLSSARRLKLSPLTQAELALLVESMLQLPPDDRDTVAARLTVESGGNPFYALELMSALADAGMLTLTGRGTWSVARGFVSQALPLPPSLRAAIKLRLDQLSDSARKVLHAAATLKRPIDPEAAQMAAGLSPDEFQPAIDELLSKRLLRLPHDGHPGYDFAHDLIRRVAAEKTNSTPREQQRVDSAPIIRRPMRNRLTQIGLGVAVAATLIFLFTRSLRSGPPSPPDFGEDMRIVVTAFANETGDARFDRLGGITADWLTRGIAQTGLISVLPPRAGASGADSPGASMLPDEFPKLSAQIAPSMIITGAIYRSGDSIRFDAQITDARERKVLRVVDPVLASVSAPTAGLETLRQKLLATLAPSLDVRLASSAQVQSHTPSYEAYKAFAEGLDDMYARRGDAPSKFLRAYALDSAFTLPLLYAAMAYDGQGNFTGSDSLVRTLQHRRSDLAPYDRYLLDYQAARLRSNRDGAYVAARAAAAIAPGSFAAVVLAPGAALSLNHPREAVRLLSQIDREKSAAKGLPAYWNILAHSYHLLGRYEDQITVARELRRRLPEETRALYYEARALAALGRLAELDAVLSESLSLPSVPGFGPPGMGAHQVAADELRAHGYPEASNAILERGIRFYQTAPPAVRNIPRFQHEIAYALYELGRLSEARRIYERLVAARSIKGGDYILIKYYLAFVATAQGDTARANEIVRELSLHQNPYFGGVHLFNTARLAAMRGDKELAMRLIQQGTAEGRGFDHTIHHLFEFRNMRGYAPFERWLAPRG
jgi:DNA-binding SARP family transcriptional activator/tetratricopeptide (TPR) repeat protein/TolB-like protein